MKTLGTAHTETGGGLLGPRALTRGLEGRWKRYGKRALQWGLLNGYGSWGNGLGRLFAGLA
jgi:hypothetical protein